MRFHPPSAGPAGLLAGLIAAEVIGGGAGGETRIDGPCQGAEDGVLDLTLLVKLPGGRGVGKRRKS